MFLDCGNSRHGWRSEVRVIDEVSIRRRTIVWLAALQVSTQTNNSIEVVC